MKSFYSALYGLFALLLHISMVWIAVDDLWDAFAVGGWIGLVIAVVLFPATFLLFPLALGVFRGTWGQAVSMYLVLPAMRLFTRFLNQGRNFKLGNYPGDTRSNRELVINLVNKLPEDTPLKDLIRKIEFVAGVQQALAASDRGEVISIEEARQLLKGWPCK